MILDASVAAKWALPREGEDLVDEARSLMSRHAAGEIEIYVPEIFWAELGNIFWKSVQHGRWPSADARTAIVEFQNRSFGTIAHKALLNEALAIALAHQRSFYDSLYVALAVRMKIPMVTADERLVNTLGSRFPVRWLGSFSII